MPEARSCAAKYPRNSLVHPPGPRAVPDGDSFKHLVKMLHLNSKSRSGNEFHHFPMDAHLFLRSPGLQQVKCGVSFGSEGRSSQHVPGSGDLAHLDFRLRRSPSLLLFLLDCGGTLGRGLTFCNRLNWGP